MLPQEPHLSDETLLLAIEGELSVRQEVHAQAHLAACWDCRIRKQEIEAAIGEFMRLHRRKFDARTPPSDGPRALLKAHLAQLADGRRTSPLHSFRALCFEHSWAIWAAACVLACVAIVFSLWVPAHTQRGMAVTVPNPSLTPGATVLVSQGEVCKESTTNNKPVPVRLQRLVFEEYGIRTSDPAAYEIDYLVTPALGGADDIHNLWPQSRRAAVWNAEVKDALEDHLRKLVCDGQLDLNTAQREIANNWIDAYKKYFHTDRPLTRFR